MHTEATEQREQYLTFHVGGDEYALGILRVREIIEYDAVTRVPGAPRSVRGVINLRGSVVPVVDLGLKFGQPPTEVTRLTCIVITELQLDGEQVVMGVMVDAVGQVIDFLPADMDPPPVFGTRVRTEYLRGLGKIGRKFVLLLELDKVLTANELAVVAGAEGEGAAS